MSIKNCIIDCNGNFGVGIAQSLDTNLYIENVVVKNCNLFGAGLLNGDVNGLIAINNPGNGIVQNGQGYEQVSLEKVYACGNGTKDKLNGKLLKDIILKDPSKVVKRGNVLCDRCDDSTRSEDHMTCDEIANDHRCQP